MDYRVYVLNDEGHITNYFELQCSNDGEAKEKALQFLDGHDIELWQQERRIAVLKAQE